jgi:elongation factor P hydroxylase
MRKSIPILFACPIIGFYIASNALAGDLKLAQTGFQFLTVVSDARAAAMGNAVNSLSLGSSSLFFNPAGLAEMPVMVDVSASDNRWIAGIHHMTVSLAFSPWKGRYGVLGFTAQGVDYGDKFFGTVVVPEAVNENGYIDTGDIKPSALAIGVGYAKALNDRFSVGGQVRLVRQDFGDLYVPITDSTQTLTRFKKTPLAFDFGTLFKTGFKSITFGMSVRNFSHEVKYIRESFELPLVFTLGIHADLMDWIQNGDSKQSAILSIDAKHDRSHPEQVCIGIDYRLMNTLSFRIGYIPRSKVSGDTYVDENSMSYGIGLCFAGLSVDYAYAPFGVFDSVQRVTVRISR